MQEYFSLLTATGANLLINAVANKTPVKLGKIAVSDSEIAPSEAATALENTKHEFAINSLTQDPQNPSILNIEGVIPSNVGGFNIRKFAIFTQSGEMFAVGRVPLSYKPALNQGAGSDLVFKIRILIGNVSNIELKVDNSVVLATRDWSEKTFLKLTDAIDAYSKPEADDRFVQKTDKTLISEYAHMTHGQELPDGDYSSPDFWLSVKPGIYYALSEKGRNKPTAYGLVEVVSSGEIGVTWSYQGDVWKWYQTSAKTNSGWRKVVLGGDFDCSKNPNGYTRLPNGLILQWGTTTAMKVTFPIAFNKRLNVSLTSAEKEGEFAVFIADEALIENPSNTGFSIQVTRIKGTPGDYFKFYWMAIGY